MKSFIFTTLAAVSTVSAHSWIECTNQDNSLLRPWMEGNSTLNPPVIVDPGMSWYQNFCSGYPRYKQNPGNWIDESTNYAWYLFQEKNAGDTHACHPNQRTPTYQPNAPMATANPGGMIRLFFGGNGHTRGYNAPNPLGGDPGTVNVYWKGKPEMEITDQSEFTQENLLQSAGFAADSFSYPADPNIKRPQDGLVDKGNWMQLKLPADMAPGRHMMVWVWNFAGVPQWSTCFDVMISGAAAAQSGASSAAASTAPVAVVAPSASANAQVAQAHEQIPQAAASSSMPAPAPAYSAPPSSPSSAQQAPAVQNPSPAPAPAAAPAPACGASYKNKMKRHARDFQREHVANLLPPGR